MALAQRLGRSRHRIILLVLIGISLLTLDLRAFGPLETLQRFLRDALHPVTEVAAGVASPFANAWNGIFNFDDLEAENLRLEAEIARFEGRLLRVESERAAFDALLRATDISYVDNLATVAATVVRGAVGNFATHVVTIDRGRRHGIRPGMAVVTGAGMVGRVDRVDDAVATVQLITDPSLVIGVRIVSNGEVGLGRADGNLFRISGGIDHPDAGTGAVLPEIGSVVVTASSSRYPPEIPIGRVTAVRVDDALLTVAVDVEPANNAANLGYVSVILGHGVEQVPLDEVLPRVLPRATPAPDNPTEGTEGTEGTGSTDGGAEAGP